MMRNAQLYGKTRPVLILFFIGIFFAVLAPEAYGIDAYLSLKDKSRPLYLQNIKFYYFASRTGEETLIFFLNDQKKYHTYPFSNLREIQFLKLAGSRNMQPVLTASVMLKETGHVMNLTLMPLKEITGILNGRPWRYTITISGDEQEKAENLNKIRFRNF